MPRKSEPRATRRRESAGKCRMRSSFTATIGKKYEKLFSKEKGTSATYASPRAFCRCTTSHTNTGGMSSGTLRRSQRFAEGATREHTESWMAFSRGEIMANCRTYLVGRLDANGKTCGAGGPEIPQLANWQMLPFAGKACGDMHTVCSSRTAGNGEAERDWFGAPVWHDGQICAYGFSSCS